MKRIKQSKFDPYINEIEGYLNAGMTVKSIAEQLDTYFEDVVSIDALYVFIGSRGLKTKYHGGLNKHYNAPKCDSCEGCREIIGLDGKPMRMCYSTRLIANGVKTSPPWCHRRDSKVRFLMEDKENCVVCKVVQKDNLEIKLEEIIKKEEQRLKEGAGGF